MDQCIYCQGPVDQATGTCLRCSQKSSGNQRDQPTSIVLPRVAADRLCSQCGEATIIGQRFCRKCGLTLTLPSLPDQQEGQLIELHAGTKTSRARPGRGDPRSLPGVMRGDPEGSRGRPGGAVVRNSTRSWWET